MVEVVPFGGGLRAVTPRLRERLQQILDTTDVIFGYCAELGWVSCRRLQMKGDSVTVSTV